MKPLPDKLRKNGFNYTLVCRDGKLAIYRQEVTEKVQYFEVFVVKIKPESVFKGKVIPEREVFPSNEDFGKTAWSYRNYKDAEAKFRCLVEEEQSKTNNPKI